LHARGARSLSTVKAAVLGDEVKRPSLEPGSPRERSMKGRSFELRLCSQDATRAPSFDLCVPRRA
jgi:hypothetical protein